MRTVRFAYAAAATLAAFLSVEMPGSAHAADAAGVAAQCPGGYAPVFHLGGQVQVPGNYNATSLAALPSTRQTVDYFAGPSGLVSETYVGVALIDLLNAAGIVVDPTVKNDILHKYVVVEGTDCYETVLSLGELRPDFGGSAQVMVAYATGDGSPLSIDEGAARLVVPGDKKGGRYVSNIARITVRSAP